MRQFAGLTIISIAALALTACGGSGYGSTPQLTTAPMARVVQPDTLPPNTIGEELPTEGVGTKKTTWGKIGGFTQTAKAQILTFPLNATVTIKNLSGSFPHTLNIFANAGSPPAKWPSNPSLSPQAHGTSDQVGYASGTIMPGKTVKIHMTHAGKFLIGCAFHYVDTMRDVLIVKAGAKAGPASISF